jgi:hypothetical protein
MLKQAFNATWLFEVGFWSVGSGSVPKSHKSGARVSVLLKIYSDGVDFLNLYTEFCIIRATSRFSYF